MAGGFELDDLKVLSNPNYSMILVTELHSLTCELVQQLMMEAGEAGHMLYYQTYDLFGILAYELSCLQNKLSKD